MSPTLEVLNYRRLANLHRPTDTNTMRVAVHELASRGLTERDIGAALNLDPAAVRRLLNINNSEDINP